MRCPYPDNALPAPHFPSMCSGPAGAERRGSYPPRGIMKYAIIFLLILALVVPAAAQVHLPLGAPNTTEWNTTLPFEHGMDNLTVVNLTALGKINLAIGNIIYPPVYESNQAIIPWEIWIIFVIVGVLGVFAAFAYPRPEGQMIGALIGLMFSAYAFLLSALIGFENIAVNPQYLGAITMGQNEYWAMPMVIQPTYTVYNPPWLWAIILVLVFMATLGVFNAAYNLFMKVQEPPQPRMRGY